MRRSSASAAAIRSANDAASSSCWRSNAASVCRWRASSRCCPASPVCESRSAKTRSAWRTNVSTARSSSREQPCGRLLARRAHRPVELDGRRLGVPLGLAGDDALQLLDLAALDVREGRLDPARRLGLAALDLLRERLLAAPQPVGDLLDHTAPLARVRLELLERLGDGRLRRALELLPQAQDRGALLVGGRDELLGLGLDPCLRLRDQLLLTLLEPPQLRLEVLLRAIEVVAPAAEPFLDTARRPGQRVGELGCRGALALHELAAPLIRDPPLVFGKAGERVGAQLRDARAELARRGSRLFRHECADVGARLLGRVLRSMRASAEQGRDRDDEREGREDEGDAFDHGGIVVRPIVLVVALAEQLEQVAARSGADAVLAAEAHPGDRVYLCALRGGRRRPHLARIRRRRRRGRRPHPGSRRASRSSPSASWPRRPPPAATSTICAPSSPRSG